MKQKMMHDGLGSGPILNVAIFGIITSSHNMKFPKKFVFYVFKKKSFILNMRMMMTTTH